MFIARKITLAKWNPNEELALGEISADAVTADLRTRDNKLSFWRCGNGTQTEIGEVVLAMAATGDRVDRIELVWISEDELRADGQLWKDTEGRTPVEQLARQHLDVYRLDYVRLGKIAHRVADAIMEGRYERLKKERVLDILVAAVRQRRLELNDFKDKVRAEVNTSLATR